MGESTITYHHAPFLPNEGMLATPYNGRCSGACEKQDQGNCGLQHLCVERYETGAVAFEGEYDSGYFKLRPHLGHRILQATILYTSRRQLVGQAQNLWRPAGRERLPTGRAMARMGAGNSVRLMQGPEGKGPGTARAPLKFSLDIGDIGWDTEKFAHMRCMGEATDHHAPSVQSGLGSTACIAIVPAPSCFWTPRWDPVAGRVRGPGGIPGMVPHRATVVYRRAAKER